MSYQPTKVYLSQPQLLRLGNAVKSGKAISLKLSGNGAPNVVLPLTKTNLSLMKQGKSVKLSPACLKHGQGAGFFTSLAKFAKSAVRQVGKLAKNPEVQKFARDVLIKKLAG